MLMIFEASLMISGIKKTTEFFLGIFQTRIFFGDSCKSWGYPKMEEVVDSNLQVLWSFFDEHFVLGSFFPGTELFFDANILVEWRYSLSEMLVIKPRYRWIASFNTDLLTYPYPL